MSIEKEMQQAGLLAGYHYIWHALQYHLTVPHRVVFAIITEINPDGVQEKKARHLRRRTYVSSLIPDEGPLLETSDLFLLLR